MKKRTVKQKITSGILFAVASSIVLACAIVFPFASNVRRKEYTVKFDSNGGTRVLNCQPDKKGYLPEPKVYRQGYDLKYWTYKGVVWDFKKDRVTESITLRAQWNLKTYTITYELGNGYFDVDEPTEFTYEDEVCIPSPKIKGGSFMYWNCKEAYLGFGNVIKKGTSRDLTLIPTWNMNKYTVYANVYESYGNVEVSGGNYKICGDVVTLTAHITSGRQIIKWRNETAGIDILSSEESIDITVENYNMTFTVYTEEI